MKNQSSVFGKRKEPHTVIIARGDTIRHFTVRPWAVALVGSALSAIAVGYLLATSYLVLRDDLIGAAHARQARMQQAYEDRISALRAQVDRITSRQLLDQKLMESKVTELLERQSQLTARHGRLEPILERTGPEDPNAPAAVPVPDARPDIRAEIDPATTGTIVASLDGIRGNDDRPFPFWTTRAGMPAGESAADRADKLFVAINQSLRTIESEQLVRIASLAEDAYETADVIAGALEGAGLQVDADYGKQGIGGPLVPVDSAGMFESRVRELDDALDHLEAMKQEARRYPIGNPSPGVAISSGFGVRKDPLLGTPAMHAGMDFRAPMNAPIRATAPGRVIKAGWNGGYGRMVEIDHGNGYTTRFAHMKKIRVEVGDKVEVGTIIGNVGSSGRSTGAHLHYEIRYNGDALNPLKFLKAGKKLLQLL